MTLNTRNANYLDWENVKGSLIEEFLKQAKKSEKQKSTTRFLSKEKASTEKDIKHLPELVVVPVLIFGRKVLCLAMMITEFSKE